MKQAFCIADLIHSPLKEGKRGRVIPGQTEYFLTAGLQDLLSGIAACFIAEMIRRNRIPAGFCGRFQTAFYNAAAGRILDFLLWLAKRHDEQSPSKLSAYLASHEKKDDGWLKTAVRLRNQWYHPSDQSPESILRQTEQHLDNIPDFSEFGRYEVSGNNGVYWSSERENVRLSPFLYYCDDSIQVFKGFDAPDKIILPASLPDLEKEFSIIWYSARVLDEALVNPVEIDIHRKAKRRSASCSSVADRPWWYAHLWKSTAVGFLISPGAGDAMLACGDLGNKVKPTCVKLKLTGDQLPEDVFAGHLGLARAPKPNELVTFSSKDNPLVILLDADSLNPQQFLKVCFWLADIQETGRFEHLRILVERSPERLEGDQEKLWDRLPDRIDQLLHPPPRSGKEKLADFFWPSTRPKRFLGIF